MEIIQKIEGMFSSEDRDLWGLGQKLCHQYRIDYTVVVGWYPKPFKSHISIFRNVQVPSVSRFYIGHNTMPYSNHFRIKLSKDGNRKNKRNV